MLSRHFWTWKSQANKPTNVTYKNAEKKSNLSAKEVEKLEISVKEGTVERVEKWSVAYSKDSLVRAAQASEDISYVTVYIVVIKKSAEGTTAEAYEYRYYVPLPKNGEALSRSYYESVFDNEKYNNCTYTYSMNTTSEVMSIKQTMKIDYKMYITENAVKIDASVQMPSELGIPGTQQITYYFVQDGNYVKGAMVLNGEISSASISEIFGVYELADLHSFGLNDAVYSFFVKTDYGFKMNEEKLQDLLDSAFESIGGENGWKAGKSSAEYKFYVKDGRLDHTVYSVKVNLTYSGYTVKNSVEQIANYYDFGTTTVTVPNDVSAYLN